MIPIEFPKWVGKISQASLNTKNYRQLKNSEKMKNSLPEKRGMVNTENIHITNVICT